MSNKEHRKSSYKPRDGKDRSIDSKYSRRNDFSNEEDFSSKNEAELLEELHTLREDVGDEISSESDADGELLNEVNEDIDSLIVKLKTNDESLYNQEKQFFDQNKVDEKLEQRKSRKFYSEHFNSSQTTNEATENPLQTLLDSKDLDEKDAWLLKYLSNQDWKKHDSTNNEESSDSEESVIAEFEALDDFMGDLGGDMTQKEIETHSRRLETLRDKESRRALSRQRKKEAKRQEREEMEKEIEELRKKKQQILQDKLREVAKIGGLKLADESLASDPLIKTLISQLEEEWNSESFDAAMDQAFDQEEDDEEISDVAVALDEDKKNSLSKKTDELKKALEDYYNVESEAGDTTQFKYIQKEPEMFGLTLDQLIFGDEDELEKIVPMENYMPYNEGKPRIRKRVSPEQYKASRRGDFKQRRGNNVRGKIDNNRLKAYSN